MTTPTTKPAQPRAPKGGLVCPLTGRFFAGGQFIPLGTAAEVERLSRPAPLAGSVRQVAWAARLRRDELARLDEEVSARLLFLASPIRAEVAANRRAVRPLLVARHRLMAETSAAAVIQSVRA